MKNILLTTDQTDAKVWGTFRFAASLLGVVILRVWIWPVGSELSVSQIRIIAGLMGLTVTSFIKLDAAFRGEQESKWIDLLDLGFMIAALANSAWSLVMILMFRWRTFSRFLP